MKRKLLIVIILSITSLLIAEVPAKFIGIWQPENGKVIYEIYFENSAYYVKVVWVAEDADEMHKTKMGRNMIEDLEYSPAKGSLINGKLVHEKRKIKCAIEKQSDGNLQVIFKAGIIKRTKTWIPGIMRTTGES